MRFVFTRIRFKIFRTKQKMLFYINWWKPLPCLGGGDISTISTGFCLHGVKVFVFSSRKVEREFQKKSAPTCNTLQSFQPNGYVTPVWRSFERSHRECSWAVVPSMASQWNHSQAVNATSGCRLAWLVSVFMVIALFLASLDQIKQPKFFLCFPWHLSRTCQGTGCSQIWT